METSGLTILLFFILVIFLLAAFILYLFISHRTTPVSQRLALWLKAQNEADQLVETMAAQARCVLDGLRPLRRREKMKKKRIAAARRRQQQLDDGGGVAGPGGSGGYPDNDEVISQTVSTSADDDAMDEIRRRQQQYRSDRIDGHQDGTINNGDGSGAPSGGGSIGNNGPTDKSRPSEDLASERLWEFVTGWCMVGCIFAGIALIVGANMTVQNNPATETQWTFETEDGDSLMDSIISHIMKIALGIKDFEDQLMEHGIFVFVVGINGFVLVRQKIFMRRRQYEIDLQGGMMAMEPIGGRGKECYDEENALEGGNSSGSSGDSNDRGTTHHNTYTQEILQTVREETDSKNTSPRSSESKDKETDKDKDKLDAGATDGDSPDFHTMSFIAWFNYLQIGILIIEFLQLFSFPLRELMEFYNQAEKTSNMYESAKGILNVFQAATTNGTSTGSDGSLTQLVTQGLQGLHYHNGVLAFGNNTLFSFNTGASNNDSVTVASTTSESVPIQEILRSFNKTGTANMAQTAPGAHEWMEQMPMLDNGTAYITPWIKDANVSSQWIADNLPTWLPNITSLMLNSTHSITAETQKQLEDMKQKMVHAAADATVHGISTIASTIASLNGTNVFGNATLADSASTTRGQGQEKAPSKEMEGDGDIVMQVVNSLGLQPSINTHDWYLLRFWSCFAVVVVGWFVALTIHAWNRRCRRLRREGKPHWSAISVGWVSCFIPVVVGYTNLFFFWLRTMMFINITL